MQGQPSNLMKQLLAADPAPEGQFTISAEQGMVTMRLPKQCDFMGFDADMARQVGIAFMSCAAKLDYANQLALDKQGKDLDLSAVLGQGYKEAREAANQPQAAQADSTLIGEVNTAAPLNGEHAADTAATPEGQAALEAPPAEQQH